jgi:CarD family transcriptional regulator
MFDLNEKVVYPGQGVAKIARIIEKNIGSSSLQFFELAFLKKDVTVLVPTSNAENIGIRRLASTDGLQDIFTILSKPANKNKYPEFTASSWNKRSKEYQLKLQKGTIRELSEIYRDLKFIGTQKTLSFGEKNLLSQAEVLLAEEISLVKEVDADKAVEELRSGCMYRSPHVSYVKEGQEHSQ